MQRMLSEMSDKIAEIKWKDEPADHDYPAAFSYLALIFSDATAAAMIDRLKHAPVVEFCAKDIFRASGLPQLDSTNYHVKKNIAKITVGDKLSPILIIRDTDHGKVIVADGFHRLCAVRLHDEDAKIPVKIV